MPNQLLICDKDKFACFGELIFFYQLAEQEHLPDTAILLNSDVDKQVYAITLTDFNQASFELPSSVEFQPFRQLIGYLPMEQAHQLAKAMQLIRWHSDHQFCSRCGSATQPHPSENATVCPSCHYHQYPRIQPCIITAIVKTGEEPQLLLAHHQRAKGSGMYTVIAGFVEVGESFEQCVHREVKEEVGLTVGNLYYISSQPWPFPSNLMIGFVAEYDSGEIVIEEHELIHADFFAIKDLKNGVHPVLPPKGTIAHLLIEKVKEIYA